MKKKLVLFFAIVLTVSLLLASCGAKSEMDAVGYGNGAVAGEAMPGDYSAESPSSSGDGDEWGGLADDAGGAVKLQTSLGEKIIYSSDVAVETVEFDKAVESVEAMLTRYGAFLESSSVAGKSYAETASGRQTYRQAVFVIRVPVDAFGDMNTDLENVGNVTNHRVYTENITERYYDTQSRVDSYRVEQERLLAMLEKCGTVTEMIEIESRLSEVRYELEALESTLRNWQNRVDYSTVNVTLNEVREYTKPVEIHRTYWQQIGDGLRNTLENIGEFFKELFRWIVVNLPTIVLIAAFAAVVVVLVLAVTRKVRARKVKQDKAVDAVFPDVDRKE